MRLRERLPNERICGLTRAEFARLARFNTEVNHGIMHTREYQNRMEKLRVRYEKGSERERRTQEETGVMIVERWSPNP